MGDKRSSRTQEKGQLQHHLSSCESKKGVLRNVHRRLRGAQGEHEKGDIEIGLWGNEGLKDGST